MPSFTVTAAGQSVQIDQAGGGQAAFTVTNTTPASVTGRLLVTPQAPAPPEWFTIAGPSTRSFAPGAAESVAAQVVVPQGTAPGTYSFRIDAVAENNPDEDFTEGPPVSFEVKPTVVVPKKPWWILIVVALVLLGGGAAFALTRGGKPATPSVTTPAKAATIIGNPPVLNVVFAPVKDADRYRIEVEHCSTTCDKKGTTQLFDLSTAATTQQFQVPLGANRVRVTASKGGKAGDPSEWIPFSAAPPGGSTCSRCGVKLQDALEVHALPSKFLQEFGTKTTP